MYGFRLVLALIITGGIIAFIGDKIGHRVGRQRLTIFGLRPRYTSILVTILTGIFIAGASLGILTIVSGDVRTALFAMKTLKANLVQSQGALKVKEKELGEKQLQAQKLESQIAERNKQYESVAAELGDAKKQWEFEKGRVDRLKDLDNRLRLEVDALNQEKGKLEKEIGVLQTSLYFGNLAFRADEIVAATVIQGGQPLDVTRKNVLAFLNGPANDAAVRRVGEVSGGSAMQLVSEQLDQVVTMVSETPGPIVLRVVAWSNTLTHTPVPVYLELYRNEKIYGAGETIATRTVNASENPDQLLDEILKLLAEVNQRVVQKGMITTPEGTVGQTTGWDDIPTLINQIKEMGGKVQVKAVAAADIWTTKGPLQVKLQAVPAQ